MKKRILFIINPIAGVKRKDAIPAHIAACLNHDLYEHQIVYTERRGHATEIAEQAVRDGIDVVVVAGGDGSVNEVACALIGSDTVLVILPFGSGNCLARHLGYPMKVREAIGVLNHGSSMAIDVGTVNGRPFFSLIGIGFDAFVAKVFDREKARGFAAYTWSAIKSLGVFKPFDFDIENDGQRHTGSAFMINICNSNQYGYDVQIAPLADIQDGELDIVLLRNLPKWRAVLLVLQVLLNRHHNSRTLQYMRGKEIAITSSRPAYLQIDGETFRKEKEFRIKVLPRALKVMANR